jgi:hypothetical protein
MFGAGNVGKNVLSYEKRSIEQLSIVNSRNKTIKFFFYHYRKLRQKLLLK